MNEEERYKYNTALRLAIEKVKSMSGDNSWKPCDDCVENDCEGCALDTTGKGDQYLERLLGANYTPFYPDRDMTF